MEARGCSSRADLPAANTDPWSEVKIRLAHHRLWLRAEHPEWDALELELEARAALRAVEMMLAERQNAGTAGAVPAIAAPPARVRGRCWSFLRGCLWLKAQPEKGIYRGHSPLAVAICAGAIGWGWCHQIPVHPPVPVTTAPPARATAAAEQRAIDFILQHAPAHPLRADHLVDDLSAQYGQDSDFVQKEIAAGRMGFDEKSGRLFKR